MTDDSLNQLPAAYRELTNILREPLELSRTLKLVMDAAMRLTGAERGVFMLKADNESEYGGFPRLRTTPFVHAMQPLGNGSWLAYALACKALQDEKSIFIGDSSSDSIFEDKKLIEHFIPMPVQEILLKDADKPWVRSNCIELEQDYPVTILVLPLKLPKNQVGSIYLSRGKYLGEFNADQIEQVEIFARLVASQVHAVSLLYKAQEEGNKHIKMMAFELKGSLISIKGFSKLISTDVVGPLTDTQRSFMETIVKNAERALWLVENIPFLTAVETGMLHFDIRDTEMYELIHNQIKFYNPIFETKQQKLSVALTGDSLHVLADRWRLEQVIRAMLRNAHNFTPEGGEIKITTSIEGEFAQFVVSDTGIGLTPDEKSHLFQKFRRTTRANEKHYGYGLDLYLAKHIIEHLGGQISADGEIDQGSRFWFTVPISSDKGEN